MKAACEDEEERKTADVVPRWFGFLDLSLRSFASVILESGYYYRNFGTKFEI